MPDNDGSSRDFKAKYAIAASFRRCAGSDQRRSQNTLLSRARAFISRIADVVHISAYILNYL